ncbi:Fe-S cluster assembly sulfur transfer protein SufU [Porticoccus sp.]
MNPELRELYQDVIVEHGRHPRNFGVPAEYSHCLEGYNPLCGDKLTLYLHVEDGIIADIGFDGIGCAISMASASLMGERLKGHPVGEALVLFERVHQLLLTGKVPEDEEGSIGKLAVLGGVSEFPTRIKCATLAWHTLKGALEENVQPVTTEE